MIVDVTLEQIIRRHIALPNTPSGTGWFPVLCKVCNDGGRKGPRAGFKFEDNKTCYHCFNCGMATVYDPETQRKMPNKMVQVLRDFSIPEDEWQGVLITSLKNHTGDVQPTVSVPPVRDVEPASIPLPSHFYPLAEASPNDKWADIAKDYLEEVRGIDPNSYPFMLAHKTGVAKLDRWFKRIIIPIFKDNNLIFYFGRDLTGKNSKKYLSPSFSKEKILYGFDRLFGHRDEPLYIVEGWFDAFSINGVAILGNELSDTQITWLNKSHRNKVYIPDRFGNGRQTAEHALELGWSIATPGINTWSADIKDMNDAVKRYGKVFVMKSIAETTATGFTAKVNLEMFCKHEQQEAIKNRSTKKNRATSS